MADEKDQLEIELDLDAKAEPENEVVIEKEDDKPAPAVVEDPTDAIRELRMQLERERQARYEAEQFAQRAAHQANAAYSEVDDTNVQLVNSAIDKIKTDNSMLTSQYAEAMQVNDFERASQIQSVISQNAAKMVQLENGLQEMQRTPRRMPVQPVQPQPPGSLLDQVISSVSEPSANWLRANRGSIPDTERSMKRMGRAHDDAVDDGIVPDTPEYFRYIEQRMGINKPVEQENPMSAAAKPVQRSAPPAAAPVNRGNGTRQGVVKLSGVEAETAKMLGMTEKEYALNKLALQREGKLPN